jgi:hypothetical protein
MGAMWVSKRGEVKWQYPGGSIIKFMHIHTMDNKESKLTLTRAPMTPKLVRRRYSNGLVLLVVLRKGYKNKGIWATSILRRGLGVNKSGNGHETHLQGRLEEEV